MDGLLLIASVVIKEYFKRLKNQRIKVIDINSYAEPAASKYLYDYMKLKVNKNFKDIKTFYNLYNHLPALLKNAKMEEG